MGTVASFSVIKRDLTVDSAKTTKELFVLRFSSVNLSQNESFLSVPPPNRKACGNFEGCDLHPQNLLLACAFFSWL